MAFKFFYLYLTAAILAFLWAAYRLYEQYPSIHNLSALYFIPTVLLAYLAYKTYHEKKDKEMM